MEIIQNNKRLIRLFISIINLILGIFFEFVFITALFTNPFNVFDNLGISIFGIVIGILFLLNSYFISN